jgi:hypothetical protein
LAASLLAALAWLSPFLVANLRLDHRPAAVQARLAQAQQGDNDITAILRAAPAVDLHQVGHWFGSGSWLDEQGGGPFWRPLVSLLWWAEYRLWGADLACYNLLTIGLVALTGALAAVAMAILCRSLLAGAGTALFMSWKMGGQLSGILGWFPAQTDVLAGTWAAAASVLLVLSTRSMGRRRGSLYGLSLGCYVFASLSKESAIAFPLMAAALLWSELRRGSLRWIGGYLLAGVGLVVVRTALLGGLGHFLVPLHPGHLLYRALFTLAGTWLGVGLTGWQAVAAPLLAGVVALVLMRPDLVRRRTVGYGLIVLVPAALILSARVTTGNPLVLLVASTWRPLLPGLFFLLCGLLVAWRRPAEAAVLLCTVAAASAQLVLVRDWLRPHYFYLPAIAWACLDSLAVAAAWEWWTELRASQPRLPAAEGATQRPERVAQ